MITGKINTFFFLNDTPERHTEENERNIVAHSFSTYTLDGAA